MGSVKDKWIESMCLTAEEEARMPMPMHSGPPKPRPVPVARTNEEKKPMSKSAEAQSEVEEQCRARVETLEAYCAFMGLPIGCAKECEASMTTKLDGHAASACFIVVMLGPKLDAIIERLDAIAPNASRIERSAQLHNEARECPKSPS
jgi:hypothetical protein